MPGVDGVEDAGELLAGEFVPVEVQYLQVDLFLYEVSDVPETFFVTEPARILAKIQLVQASHILLFELLQDRQDLVPVVRQIGQPERLERLSLLHLDENETDDLVKHCLWLLLQLFDVSDGKLLQRVALVGDASEDVLIQLTEAASFAVLDHEGELDETLGRDEAICNVHDAVQDDRSALKWRNIQLNDLIVVVILL